MAELICNPTDGRDLDDVLCDRDEPWANYDSPAIRRCVRNDAIVEILFRAGQLALCMPENTPDRERIHRRCWAVAHAAMAMQDALKPYADPII